MSREFDLIAMKIGKSILIDSLSSNKEFTLVINLSEARALSATENLIEAVYDLNIPDTVERMLSDLHEADASFRFTKYIFYTGWNFSEEQVLVDQILDLLDGRHIVFMVNGL